MKKNEKKNKPMQKIIAMTICCIIIITAIISNYNGKDYRLNTDSDTIMANVSAVKSENSEFIYLSDIDYIETESKSGWGSLLKDKTSANGRIQIKINGGAYSFDKGMWAHASSILMYDIIF